VPNNIIEGNAHKNPTEFARFLGYALASAWEVEGHLQLARDFDMLTEKEFATLLEKLIDVRGKLYGLIRTLSGIPRKNSPQKNEIAPPPTL
jgi:four helix bundle protein